MDEEVQQSGAEDTLENEGGGEGEGISPEIIERAKEMGWTPKEEFRGDPEKFIDADEFVQRGETLMPILKASNRRLQAEVRSTKDQLTQTSSQISMLEKELLELKKAQIQNLRQSSTSRRDELRLQIEQARADREPEKVVQLQSELDEVEQEIDGLRDPEPRKPPTTTMTKEQMLPIVQEWQESLDWWGKDERMTTYANGLAARLRQDPEWAEVTGRPFLDEISRRTEKAFEDSPSQRGINRTAGGSLNGARSTSTGGRRGKSFSDLPADAQAQCLADTQNSRIVGTGRTFKTVDEYKAFFVKTYFEN